jgi:hypothetical protein
MTLFDIEAHFHNKKIEQKRAEVIAKGLDVIPNIKLIDIA